MEALKTFKNFVVAGVKAHRLVPRFTSFTALLFVFISRQELFVCVASGTSCSKMLLEVLDPLLVR